ncbi:MAG: thiamine pyrophosphate-dependent enzyme [Candidatus Moranbacteria bacterium]|nr:thiamine pyrophosphate-dependent enzyme [Candidatus Moranbacteria bacterium]
MNTNLAKYLAPGHSTCAGCGIPAIVRTVLEATKDPVIVVNVTGCLEVTSTLYPYSAWKVPYIHSAFENGGATAAGVAGTIKAFRRRNKIPAGKKIQVVVFAGDGGTYDIGLQSLSGALERQHDFLYVCYDNEAYMNTGGQRSGATPYGADTETTPSGKQSFGKREKRKDLMSIVVAHHLKYAAQANVAYLPDLKKKAEKAFEMEGPRFLLVLQPCTNLWKYATSEYVNIGKLATETNFWPLWEYLDGKYKINWATEKPKPIEEFLKTQGRFKHLFKPGNEHVIAEMQKEVDENWRRLMNLAEVD